MQIFGFGSINSKNWLTRNIVLNTFNSFFKDFKIEWEIQMYVHQVKIQRGYYEIKKLWITVLRSIAAYIYASFDQQGTVLNTA